jgi:hypothetical protein
MSVQTINSVYSPHPIVEAERSSRTRLIRARFGAWLPAELSDYHYSLYRFARFRPLKYIDKSVIDESVGFFQGNVSGTLAALSQFGSQLSTAIFALLRRTPSWDIEDTLSLNRPEDIGNFDSIWHPEYQRYSEHVLNHLIQIPLSILGSGKSKNYTSQALSNRVDLLVKNSLGFFCEGFMAVVRNAISHGTVHYEIAEVMYVDKQSSIRLSHFEFAEHFDQLVSTCCSIVCSLLIFLAEYRDDLHRFGLQKLPLGFRFLLVDAETSHNSFWPVSMVESEIGGNTKQLNAVCVIASKSRNIHLFEGLSICRALSNIGGEFYDRYFISMDCGFPVPSSLVVDGEYLRETIKDDTPIAELPQGMFEAALMWYDTIPIMRKLYFYRSMLKAMWRDAKSDVVRNWAASGLDVLSSKYLIRGIENVSSEKHGRIHAHIVLDVRDTISDVELLKIAKHAIRRLKRRRVRRLSGTGEIGLPVRPRYIWLRVCAEDGRLRTLKSMSWANESLLASAEWISSPKVMDYFYTKQYDLIDKRVRLKLNPNLVSSE